MQTRNDRQNVIHRMVFELRYDYGFTYLDRCGAAINDILSTNPGWDVSNSNQGGTMLRNQESGAAFSFGTQKIDFAQEQNPTVHTLMTVEHFASLSMQFSQLVIDRIGFEHFTRMGFRIWQLFGTDTLEEARKNIKKINFLSIESLDSTFGVTTEEVSFHFIVERGGYRSRVGITPVEQQIKIDPATIRQAGKDTAKLSSNQKSELIAKLKAKKVIANFPQFSVLIDIDTSLEDFSYPENPSINDFISDSYGWSLDAAKKIVDLKKKG